eukprot:c13669_g1_i1 orf=100-255(+)
MDPFPQGKMSKVSCAYIYLFALKADSVLSTWCVLIDADADCHACHTSQIFI